MTDRGLVSRRQLIAGVGVAALGAGTLAAVEAGVLPGRNQLHSFLGLNNEPAAAGPPSTGTMVSGEFSSQWMKDPTGWAINYPPGTEPGDPLPVLVALHGYNSNHEVLFDNGLNLDFFQAEEIKNGAAPFAIASVDGSNIYWHRRRSGFDPARMVREEFLPLLTERGLSTAKIGLFGISVGGFGAILLARTLGPERVAAVVTDSGAFWVEYGDAPAIAFDDEADFLEHTPFGRQHELDGIAVRIDCGLGDDYYLATRAFVDGFETPPTSSFEPGAHEFTYWQRMAPAQMRFVAEHLSS